MEKYISIKYSIDFEWGVDESYIEELKEEMKELWILYLLPVFGNKKDAENFCWNWNYKLI